MTEMNNEAYKSVIKEVEKNVTPLNKPIIGILKWYNNDKGFGIIGTPENVDYFLHKSNLLPKTLYLVTENVLVFEEKIENGKKSAIHCKLANDFQDLNLAFNYISKKDNVQIDVKTFNNYKGGTNNYSTQIKQISLLKESVIQILKTKKKDKILKFLSNFFLEKVIDKSSEEQLHYFNYIKNIFEKTIKIDENEILTSFFTQHSNYIINQPDFSFSLWLKGYTQEKDLRKIAQQMTKESIGSNQNQFPQIFEKINEPNEQEALIQNFLDLVGNIDSQEKFIRVKLLADCSSLDKNLKEWFLNSVYSQSDIERQFQLWLTGYTQEKNLSYIAKIITTEPIGPYQNPFTKIFERLNEPTEQERLLEEFLGLTGNIDSQEMYDRIISLARSPALDNNVRKVFLNSVYSQSDNERQILLWLEGHTQQKDLYKIAQQITKESIGSYQNLFTKIFEKIKEPSEQERLLKEFLVLTGRIDSPVKYNRAKSLAGCAALDKNVKEIFLNSLYSQSDIERQFLLWIEGYTQEKKLSYIGQQISKESIGLFQNPITRIFEKLTIPSEQETVLEEFLRLTSNIDSKEKYIRVKSLVGCSALDEKVKERFQIQVFNAENVHYQTELFLNNIQFTEGDHHNQIIRLFDGLDIISFFSFCLDLLDPLVKLNCLYFHNGKSYLKNFLENKDYIQETNSIYEGSSVYSYKGILLNEKQFAAKITYFKTILSYNEFNLSSLERKAKDIIDLGDLEIISKFLNIFQVYYKTQFQICSELQIESPSIPNIEIYIVDKCDTSQLLKLWVQNLIDYFDFNTYCFYYFTLSLEERKIFNKKVKAKMDEEIKNSMLKKREPWKLIEIEDFDKNREMENYTATWKSIWFGNGCIRICMDNKPIFSKPFIWNFSEEKFNFLYEYISGKRLSELKIIASGDNILRIEGLEELEEIIWKILIIQESTGGTIERGIGTNRIPVNMILRNQCIQLLNTLQLKDLQPTRVLEKTFNPLNGGIGVDVSLLYSIPISEFEVAIIWESLELEKAKATHIFKCIKSEYEKIFSEIEFYLSGNLKVRSSLNSRDTDSIENQNKIRYLTRIEHDNFNFNKWANSLYQILPGLKEV